MENDGLHPSAVLHQVDRSYWAICIDNDGNLVGIIPFRNGRDARKMSVNNHFKMLVNTTDRAPALGYAILKNLAYADGLRVGTRKADGLETPVPRPAVKVVVPPKACSGCRPRRQKPAAAPAAEPGTTELLRKTLPERKKLPLWITRLKAATPRRRMTPLPTTFKMPPAQDAIALISTTLRRHVRRGGSPPFLRNKSKFAVIFTFSPS